MFIRSQSLFLRPVWAEDWADIHTGLADEAVARHLASVAWPYGEAEARQFANQPQHQRYPHFLITRVHDSVEAQPVGCIALTGESGAGGPRHAALGFWIARAHWGKGYASEAARAVLELLPVLGHRRLLATAFRDNTAAARVLRKLGFYATGQATMATSAARGARALATIFALDLAADGNGGCGEREVAKDRSRALASLRAA